MTCPEGETLMNQTELEEILIEVVCRLQELSGREKVSVTSDTKPVLDMPGFDSLNGVEATVEVLDRLKLDLGFNDVFIAEDKNKALTIREAAARLCASMEQ
jgi:acyl carrier protein